MGVSEKSYFKAEEDEKKFMKDDVRTVEENPIQRRVRCVVRLFSIYSFPAYAIADFWSGQVNAAYVTISPKKGLINRCLKA